MNFGKQILDFFKSDYWAKVEEHLNNPDTHHVHVYVNTSVEPHDLEKALLAYFDAKGWGSRRKIDHMAPRLGTGALHGIHPVGKPHFDIMFNYKEEVILEPMDPLDGEMGSNLLAWGDKYMENYMKNYHPRPFDAFAEEALEKYFKSEHWEKGLEKVLPEDHVHVHINTETSIDPEMIRKYALKALAKKGWEVEEAVHCVFAAKGAYYQGKIVFLCNKPMRVFDISWKYNAKVCIVPTEDWIVWKDQKHHDVWTKQMLQETVLDKGTWKGLSDEDIKYIRENA